MAVPAHQGPRCQTRQQNARCLFLDGHPGAHLCVPSRGSVVFLTGSGGIPDDEWCSRPPAGPNEGDAAAEPGWGEWTGPMLLRLLREVREAGASPPRRWNANLERLRDG